MALPWQAARSSTQKCLPVRSESLSDNPCSRPVIITAGRLLSGSSMRWDGRRRPSLHDVLVGRGSARGPFSVRGFGVAWFVLFRLTLAQSAVRGQARVADLIEKCAVADTQRF